MKSNIEKVYSKLPKIELATQKVELGLVDDIETIFDDVVKQNDKIESLAKELRSVSVKTAVKIEKMRKMRTQVEAKAKELGVDVDTVIAGAMLELTTL